MILKNIFGKTIEAAKKSAQQMYGDDFLVIESSEGKDGGRASITIFSDGKKKENGGSAQQYPQPKPTPAPQQETKTPEEPGVKFERSASAQEPTPKSTREDNLSKLRQFAEQLDQGKFNTKTENFTHGNTDHYTNGTTHQQNNSAQKEDGNSAKSGTTAYSRSAIRNPINKEAAHYKSFANNSAQNGELKKPASVDKSKEGNSKGGFITHFKQSENSRQKQEQPLMVPPNRNNQREINALHKRFDKLEALLDSTMISANLDYASHPAFQQLVRTGINTTVIAGWFSQIISKGIDPEVQPEQFMSKLAGIIRSALGEMSTESTQKYMLFVGPSGAGKTSMIMKLSQHPELMEDKKVAVATIFPQQKNETPYYTILKPFCEDHELPYFEIRKPKDVHDLMEQWNEFDHVLIDTPSINIEQENSFRNFWKIRQMLTPLTPLEVHYVVNASLNRFYFKHSSATHHPIQPDYVAITHLDEVSQWGPIIPFLQEMECSARYVTRGEAIPASADIFDPRWFAQRILQEN